MFALSRVEWLVLAAALLLCPGFSWSAEPDARSIFERLDRDNDGYLSKEELAAPEAQNGNWIAIDRDRDGRISRAEFGTVVAQPSPQQSTPSAAAGGTNAARGAAHPAKPE